jgi:hypothetical protein
MIHCDPKEILEEIEEEERKINQTLTKLKKIFNDFTQ